MIWTGFLIGLLGSFHCVGMCGPIVMTLPDQKNHFIQSRLLYNLGRTISYTLLGLLAGLFGQGLQLAGWQQGLSIATGVFIILSIFINRGQSNIPSITKAVNFLKRNLGSALKGNGKTRFLMIGTLNGLLPCGFVYLALAGAINAPVYWQSGLYMALFGLGTIPLMFAFSISGRALPVLWRIKLNKVAPYLAGCLAILFIIRGLNLGIPYVSPKLVENNVTVSEISECH